jgi:hypothetical protein
MLTEITMENNGLDQLDEREKARNVRWQAKNPIKEFNSNLSFASHFTTRMSF